MDTSAHPVNPRGILQAYHAPGIFVTGIGSDIGKTVVTAALAAAFHRLHLRVGLCKALASGCPLHTGAAAGTSDEDFGCPDAEYAARAAGLDPADRSLLRYLSPIRYATPAAPSVAARVESRSPDWRRLQQALDWWQENCQILMVEGAGGWYVPLEPPPHDFMIADLAAALRLPVLIVTTPLLGTLNQTLLTIHAVQSRNLPVAGLVVNRVPPPDASGRLPLVVEWNLKELPRLSGLPIRAILPDLGSDPAVGQAVPEQFVQALEPFAREWWTLIQSE